MASMGGGHLNPEPLVRLIRGAGMLNKILSTICKREGLPSNGVKAELQLRIENRIRHHALMNNTQAFERLQKDIESPYEMDAVGASPHGGHYSSSPVVSSPARNYNNGYGSHGINGPGSLRNINFKSSPYYTIEQQLGETKQCDTMTQHRHTVGIQIKAIDYPILSTIQDDSKLRIMVFCAGEAGNAPQDVSFPNQSEVKVNGGEIKANLRGLKNKPGSTRPVDITNALRLRPPTYQNNVEMTYALTTKAGGSLSQKFFLLLYLVKTVPVKELVKTLATGRRISKDTVINEMTQRARDDELTATSTVLSLKCPLSTLRIDLPCRAVTCTHISCFDATSFLQLQEQGPTWVCPICTKPAPFHSLAVDEYMKDILSNTQRSVDQVTIEPDGSWSQNKRSASPSNNFNGQSFASDDDDDLVEIRDIRVTSLRNENIPTSLPRTPPTLSSREASASISLPTASASRRRQISELIDLTGSSDDDDEPIARAPKRQQTSISQSLYSLPNGRTNGHSST